MAGVYVPRSPTTGVLYGVVRAHLADFLATVAARTDGNGLPAFVTAEFRKFLRCGALAHGFARVRCEDCAFERLVPFSCKGRGFCPSCGGRRMAERAAHLVERSGIVCPAPAGNGGKGRARESDKGCSVNVSRIVLTTDRTRYGSAS